MTLLYYNGFFAPATPSPYNGPAFNVMLPCSLTCVPAYYIANLFDFAAHMERYMRLAVGHGVLLSAAIASHVGSSWPGPTALRRVPFLSLQLYQLLVFIHLLAKPIHVHSPNYNLDRTRHLPSPSSSALKSFLLDWKSNLCL